MLNSSRFIDMSYLFFSGRSTKLLLTKQTYDKSQQPCFLFSVRRSSALDNAAQIKSFRTSHSLKHLQSTRAAVPCPNF